MYTIDDSTQEEKRQSLSLKEIISRNFHEDKITGIWLKKQKTAFNLITLFKNKIYYNCINVKFSDGNSEVL